jgi:enoyl-CoA hydratase/carnithine racemase
VSEPNLRSDREGAVQILLLNRPSTRNALDEPLVTALGDALERAETDPEVRAVVLGGSGGAFSSGVDLRSAVADIDAPARLAARIDGFHRLIRAVALGTKPVLAAVDGAAVGFGADLAFACDLRLASKAAYFEEVFVNLGLMPDGGSTFHVSRLIGLGRALELLLLGSRVEAAQALELGLVNRVVSPDLLLREATELATRLAAAPPLAVARIKRAVRDAAASSLEEALGRERRGQLELLAGSDARDRIQAFLGRRKPG